MAIKTEFSHLLLVLLSLSSIVALIAICCTSLSYGLKLLMVLLLIAYVTKQYFKLKQSVGQHFYYHHGQWWVKNVYDYRLPVVLLKNRLLSRYFIIFSYYYPYLPADKKTVYISREQLTQAQWRQLSVTLRHH